MTEEQPGTNNGIVISGNARVNDSALAAGRGARAHRSAGSAAVRELREQLDELRRRLDDEQDSGALTPETWEAASEEADVLEAELVRENPEPRRISACLRRLRVQLADAAALTTVITGMQAGLRALNG